MSDMHTRFRDPNSSLGVALVPPHGPLRIKLLAHSVCPRACPVLRFRSQVAEACTRPLVNQMMLMEIHRMLAIHHQVTPASISAPTSALLAVSTAFRSGVRPHELHGAPICV